MFTSIIVPLDGSSLSERVLPYAGALAAGFKSDIVLLHSVDQSALDMLWEPPQEWMDRQGIRERAEKTANEYLTQAGRVLVNQGIGVETLVTQGKPADAILTQAEGDADGLIAMCTQGSGGITRFLLGSVANHVLLGTRSPLLLVRPSGEEPGPLARLEEIVVPLDTSDVGESVLPLARQTAKALDLTMTLVTVVPTPSRLYLGTEFAAHPPNMVERVESAVHRYLADLTTRIATEDGLIVRWEVLRGDAAKSIVEFARGRQHNIIAMSTHGRSGMRRWVLGSVTDKVVRSSGDPVLVVRPPES